MMGFDEVYARLKEFLDDKQQEELKRLISVNGKSLRTLNDFTEYHFGWEDARIFVIERNPVLEALYERLSREAGFRMHPIEVFGLYDAGKLNLTDEEECILEKQFEQEGFL